MNNYVSFNAKYYKNSNAEGEIGHVQRQFNKNKNAIEHLTSENFDCGFSIIDKYKEIHAATELDKGKKVQKNANTFIDGVLSFSREHFEEMKKGPNWKKEVTEHIEKYMSEVQKQTGLTPVGWAFHMDEGFKDETLSTIEGEDVYNMNYHAQLIFYNYDFETKKAPLRSMMGRGNESAWSALQDLAGNVFEPLGFERGKVKEDIHADHLEKDKFIDKKQAEILNLQEELEHQVMNNKKYQKLIGESLDSIKDEYNELVDDLKKYEDHKEKFNIIKPNFSRFSKYLTDQYNKPSIFRSACNYVKDKHPGLFENLKQMAVTLHDYFNTKLPDLKNTIELLNNVDMNIEKLKEIQNQITEEQNTNKNKKRGKYNV